MRYLVRYVLYRRIATHRPSLVPAITVWSECSRALTETPETHQTILKCLVLMGTKLAYHTKINETGDFNMGENLMFTGAGQIVSERIVVYFRSVAVFLGAAPTQSPVHQGIQAVLTDLIAFCAMPLPTELLKCQMNELQDDVRTIDGLSLPLAALLSCSMLFVLSLSSSSNLVSLRFYAVEIN